MVKLVGRLTVVSMVSMMMLLGMVGMMVLMLELWHLHCKPLVSLSSIQHGGMLSLVSLAVHAVGI